ncbi:MAG: PQQ-binding-like beta-propeller repeat protein [Pseudomonadota bacterium]
MTTRLDTGAGRRATCAAGWVLVASLVLSACAEEEVILPGKREDIRSVVSEDNVPAQPAAQNTSRPISLPAQTQNAEWSQSPGTPAFRTAHPALRSAPALAWRTNIGAGDGRRVRITASPVVGAGRIFTLDAGTQVTAVAQTGEVVWRADLASTRAGSNETTGGGLAFADGRLFVSLGVGELVALNAVNGDELWRQELAATASGSPAVVDGLVYLVAGDETGWAVLADSGRVAWQLIAPPDSNNVLGAPAPAISSDIAIFAFGSGELQAVFRRGGLRRWDASVVGERPGAALAKVSDVTGAPVIAGSRVYAGNQSGRTVALDLGSGSRIWTARDGAIGPIVPAGDSVFFLTEEAQLVRVDASDGSRVWAADLPRFVRDRPRRRTEVFAHHGPVLAGGRLYVASNDGLMRVYDPVSGALTTNIDIPGGATSDPVVAGGTLYVVSTKGELLAFR